MLTLSPDGKHLIIGTWMRAIVWNIQAAKEDFSCTLSREITCTCAAVSPDGTQLITGGVDVERWDFHTGKRIGALSHSGRGTIGSLRFSPNGRFLVALMMTGKKMPSDLVAWHDPDYSKAQVMTFVPSELDRMCFFPGTNKLVTAGSHGAISVWDLDKLKWDDAAGGTVVEGDHRD